jgi:hypothetical protein
VVNSKIKKIGIKISENSFIFVCIRLNIRVNVKNMEMYVFYAKLFLECHNELLMQLRIEETTPHTKRDMSEISQYSEERTV